MQNLPTPIRTVGPSVEPLSLADVKAHLRVDHSDEDTTIALYLSAAVAYLDGWGGVLGRCLINQTWRQDYAGFEDQMRLPFVGASDVVVTYRDALEASVTLPSSDAVLMTDALGAYLVPALNTNWPATGETSPVVSITAVYGFGAAGTSVPASIRAAILLHVGQMYADREGGAMPPPAWHALIAPYRRVGV